jgi:hypothetical protein
MAKKKDFPFKKYIFKWEDPTGHSEWMSKNDMNNVKPSVITTEAYLYSKDHKHIKTFSSYIEEEDGSYTFGDVNVFIASGLVKMTKI